MYKVKLAHLLQQGVSAYLIAIHKYHGYQQLSFVFIIFATKMYLMLSFSYILIECIHLKKIGRK